MRASERFLNKLIYTHYVFVHVWGLVWKREQVKIDKTTTAPSNIFFLFFCMNFFKKNIFWFISVWIVFWIWIFESRWVELCLAPDFWESFISHIYLIIETFHFKYANIAINFPYPIFISLSSPFENKVNQGMRSHSVPEGNDLVFIVGN